MKLFKRMLFVSLCTLLLAGLLCACATSSDKDGYAVTLIYDKDYGTAELSTPASGTLYARGERVILTVSPFDGCTVESVSVGGETVSLTDGQYIFFAERDTEVRVVFYTEPALPGAIPAALLRSIAVKVTFDGTFTHDFTPSGGEKESRGSYTSFGEDTVWVRETEGETVCYDYVGVNRGGRLALPYHDKDNKIAYFDMRESFQNVCNPFSLLGKNDLIRSEEGVYAVTDLSKAKRAAEALTGYSETVSSFLLYTNGDRAERVVIRSSGTSRTENGTLPYEAEYIYNIKDIGQGALPEKFCLPYESGQEHRILQTALAQAAQAKSYTVTCEKQEGDTLSRSEISVMEDSKDRASFSGFSPVLFSYEGEGVYTLRSDFVVPGYASDMPSDVAAAFAAGEFSFDYVSSVRIVLKEGVLSEVTIGTLENITYTLTFTGLSDV